jgi:hypothetical protein
MSQKQEQAQFMLTEVVFSSKVGVANLEQYRSRRTVATFVFYTKNCPKNDKLDSKCSSRKVQQNCAISF